MKKISRIFIVFTLCINPISSIAQDFKCTISGTIYGHDCKTILMFKDYEDFRFDAVRIPIIDNKFKYEFISPYEQKYIMIFEEEIEQQGWAKPVYFFSEKGTIEFTLNLAEENEISGGTINKEMADFETLKKQKFDPFEKPILNTLDSLYKADDYLTDKSRALNEKLKNAKSDSALILIRNEHNELVANKEAYTERVSILRDKLDSISKLRSIWQNEYIKSNLDIFSYSLLFWSLRSYTYKPASEDIGFIREIYPSFSEKFPDHPYTEKINKMFNAFNLIKIGSNYIDFSAQTIDGRTVKISDEIKGKVALIDLWASWCGICRYKSMSNIPIYEKYKVKGFVIIGVACEHKNTNSFKAAIEKDKYPWLNLVELDNKNGIWSTYNISGSGGCKYLVDANGKILAVDPDTNLLEYILNGLLK